MKPIVAFAITIVALATACTTDNGGTQVQTGNKDVAYINSLKSKGVHAPPGMDESQWEKLSIDTAHSMCDMLGMNAGPVTMMRGQTLIDNSVGDAKVINEATVSIYCPDKR